MINLIRKNQQALMLIITVLVIISFVWLYNGTQLDRLGVDNIAKIYGRTISKTDVERNARKFELAIQLRLMDLVQNLVGTAGDRDQAVHNFVINGLVLQHEADRLEIFPTDEEVVATIEGLSPFQTNGAFDPQKYMTFSQESLGPRGFTVAQLEELIRDDLRLKKIRTLIDSTVEPSLTEFRSAYELAYGKVELSLIRFHLADFLAEIQISEEEKKKTFDERKETYKSEEKRKIKFVTFLLSEPEKTLKGKERIDVLRKLANSASEFTQAILDKNASFDETAAKFQLQVNQTQEFSQSSPDLQIAQVPGVISAAFRLTKVDPNSDAIATENGFYALHLEEIIPSRPLTLEEAGPQIIEQLKKERAQEMMTVKAGEIRSKIDADLKAGKSFSDAAKTAAQKVESIPPFSLAEPDPKAPESPEIMEKVMDLGANQLSDFVPAADGGTLIHLHKRHPIDESKFNEQKTMLLTSYAKARRDLVFREWLRISRDAAHIQFLHKT